MPSPGDVATSRVLDASVLINFGRAEAFWILQRLYAGHVVITDVVDGEEILDPSTREAADRALEAGWMRRYALQELGELRDFALLTDRLHRGEASCLAAARHHNWIVAIDERLGRRIAKSELGLRITGSVGILVRAVREGICALDAAEDYHRLMIERAAYRSPTDSIRSHVDPAE